MNAEANPARAAATVVIMRPRAKGSPELLMIERNKGMAFAGGALVFPGGAVDDQDRALAATLHTPGIDLEDLAARIAAVRETIEEAAVAVGLTPYPDPEDLLVMRQRLIAGESLASVIASFGLALDLDALAGFARWLPPSDLQERRYDTRFYLASVPAHATAEVDGHEGVDLLWASADDLLAGYDEGRHRMIFPTFCNLQRLARYASIDEARADAAAHAIDIITPIMEQRDGEPWLILPEGLGYPLIAVPIGRAVRG